MAAWQQAYLRAAGIRPTPQAVARLDSWQRWEGGATHNDATNNYLNSTLTLPGSHSINSVGVKAYATLAQGAQSFGRTLSGRPEYGSIKQWLATGKGDPTPGFSTWVSGQPDSAHGAAYASKILGTPVNPSSLGPTAPQPNSATPNLGVAPGAADSAASNALQIRSQAQKGFGDIAAGGDAIASFGDMAGLLKTLHAAAPPTIHPATQAAATANPDGLEAQAVKMVHKYLGVKYTWGGESAKTGFDCSGLLQSVWHSLGVNIPRTTYTQWDSGSAVSMKALKPGDAVFFRGSDSVGGKPGHVGMYIGGGQFIEAPHTGSVVRVSNLAGRTDYMGARRFA